MGFIVPSLKCGVKSFHDKPSSGYVLQLERSWSILVSIDAWAINTVGTEPLALQIMLKVCAIVEDLNLDFC